MPHVLDNPAAAPDTAVAHFSARLAFETDCSDVHQTLQTDPDAIVLIDARSADAFAAGHIAGAVSLPHADISAERLAARLPAPDLQRRVFVTYCWGPHCNGADRAAARIAAAGFEVKVMIGGVHGWQLEGLDLVAGDAGERPMAETTLRVVAP